MEEDVNIEIKTYSQFALVNNSTKIVENIVVIEDNDESINNYQKDYPDHKLVKIIIEEIDFPDKEKELYDLLSKIDSDFKIPEKKKIYPSINIDETMWTEENGFFEE